MIDPMVEQLRAELERIKGSYRICKRSTKSPVGARAYSYLLRESGFGDTSVFAFILQRTTNKIEAKKLENEARKILSRQSLGALKGSTAGRKCQYADGDAQADEGANWLSTRRKDDKKPRDAALWVLKVETPKRNKRNPPEWMDGYPYLNVDKETADKSLKALAGAIEYRLKPKKG